MHTRLDAFLFQNTQKSSLLRIGARPPRQPHRPPCFSYRLLPGGSPACCWSFSRHPGCPARRPARTCRCGRQKPSAHLHRFFMPLQHFFRGSSAEISARAHAHDSMILVCALRSLPLRRRFTSGLTKMSSGPQSAPLGIQGARATLRSAGNCFVAAESTTANRSDLRKRSDLREHVWPQQVDAGCRRYGGARLHEVRLRRGASARRADGKVDQDAWGALAPQLRELAKYDVFFSSPRRSTASRSGG